MGESGCGKWTTARLLMRLLEPTVGLDHVRGRGHRALRRARELKALRREMQMIFQDPYSSLNPRKTVGSIIAEPFIIHGMDTGEGERKKHVQELMDRVGLNPEHYNRYPHEFSGGQRQRIGVARAIALKPKLLIADEPVSALDVSIQAQILNLLRRPAARARADARVHRARPVGRASHVRPRRGDVPRQGRRAGADATSSTASRATRTRARCCPRCRCPIPAWRARSSARCSAATCRRPTNPPAACRFHTRCPKAQDGSATSTSPPLEGKEGGNIAACHFPLTDEEIAKRVPTAAA